MLAGVVDCPILVVNKADSVVCSCDVLTIEFVVARVKSDEYESGMLKHGLSWAVVQSKLVHIRHPNVRTGSTH